MQLPYLYFFASAIRILPQTNLTTSSCFLMMPQYMLSLYLQSNWQEYSLTLGGYLLILISSSTTGRIAPVPFEPATYFLCWLTYTFLFAIIQKLRIEEWLGRIACEKSFKQIRALNNSLRQPHIILEPQNFSTIIH